MTATQGDGDMSSLYSGTGGDSGEDTPPVKAPADSVDEEEAQSPTAVLDNKVLSPDGKPLKEGDEVVLKVVQNFGDECEVTYAPKEAKGKGSKPSGDAGESDAELEALSAKGPGY